MSNSFIMEIIFIGIIAGLIALAYKKGIFQILSGLLGTIGGAVAAFKLTPKVSGFVAQSAYRLFYGRVEKAAVSSGAQDILESAVSSDTFRLFGDLLKKLGITDSLTAEMALEAGSNAKKAAATALADRIAPIITFIVIFILIKLAIWIIIELLKLDIPVLSSFNKLAGAVMGALSACVLIFIICAGIKSFGPESGTLFCLETLEKGFIGRIVLGILS